MLILALLMTNIRLPDIVVNTVTRKCSRRKYSIALPAPSSTSGNLEVTVCDLKLQTRRLCQLATNGRTITDRSRSAMSTNITRTTRIEARIAPDDLMLFKQAAEIQGRSVSEFVVGAAREAAYRAIEEDQDIRLSAKEQRRLASALLNPPAPSPALQRAARSHKKLIAPRGDAPLFRRAYLPLLNATPRSVASDYVAVEAALHLVSTQVRATPCASSTHTGLTKTDPTVTPRPGGHFYFGLTASIQFGALYWLRGQGLMKPTPRTASNPHSPR